MTGGTLAGYSLTAGEAIVVSAAADAGFSALVSQATVSLINNQGDLGKTLEDLGSLETIKNLALSMGTAAAFAGLDTWQATDYPKLATTDKGNLITTYADLARFNTDWSVVGAKTLVAGGIGGLSSAASGGEFWTGFGIGGGLELSSGLYHSLVATKPGTWGGGEAYMGKETYVDENGNVQRLNNPIASVDGHNNFGVTENLRIDPTQTVSENPWSTLEGSKLSTIADSVPFIEATAQLHDNLLGFLHGVGPVEGGTNQWLNFGTTLPSFLLIHSPYVHEKDDNNDH